MRRTNNNIAIGAMLILFLIFGFWIRGYKLPTLLNCDSYEVTNAIRLHYLPLFNFSDTIRFNFFKSFLMGMHGVTDFLYWYLITGLYDFLKIPISEHNIYLAQVSLGIFFISFLAFFSFLMFGRKMKIALFVVILGVLNLDHIVAMSRTHWYCNSIKLLELLTYSVVFFRNNARRKIFWDIFLAGLMFLNALTPNIVIVVPILLLQYLLFLEKSKATFFNSLKEFIKSGLNFSEIMIWAAFSLGLIIDYFVQKTIGVSGLGLFGQITHSYGFKPLTNIPKGLLEVKNQLTQAPDYFYNFLWIFGALGGVFCLLGRKLENFGKRYLFFIFLLLYHFGMEIFFGRFYFYDIFIPIVTLGGVGLYYTIYFIRNMPINISFRRFIYYFIGLILLVSVFFTCIDRINLASRRDKGLNLIPSPFSFNKVPFDTFFNRINPLKTVGYYLRKNALKSDKIYTLFGAEAWSGNAEYYFGKKAMNTESGTLKQIYCSSYSLEFYKKRDGVDIFDYYIVMETFGFDDNYKSILSDAQKKGVKKIADITYEGKVYASIYSPKKTAYEVLRMEDYDKKWDKEYANLKNIYENKLVGLVSLWGLY